MRHANLPRLTASLRRRTNWLVTKPRAVVAFLAVVGLVIRHAWLTTRPLASGDWHWAGRGRILTWFPWPAVWDSTLGFSGENRFLDAFRFPLFALNGLIGALGGSWTLTEKVVYFVPYALLLPVAGWLLAREILGPTKWALLSPIILLGNTYLLLEGDGHVPLTLAEALGCLALLAFIKSMRLLSLRWGLVSGLLVGIAVACDLRPAFLTILLIIAYLVILSVAEPGWRLLGRRILLGGATGLAFLFSQMFWIVPLLTYHGHPPFPTPRAPDFSIITLGHGIAGVTAEWSGGKPAALVQAPLNPLFMALPLLAMLPVLRKRLKPELVWLALAAVVCAFLAKTDTPPFGGLYDWIYLHIPGFRLFREGSKFFYPIAIAYAVLIPAALRSMVEQARAVERPIRLALQWTTVVGLAVVLAISGSALLALQGGRLDSTTTPTVEPRAFSQLSTMLDADHYGGTVLWFGSPIYSTSDQKEHRYVIASPNHAIAQLTGSVNSTAINRRDLLQYYCPVITQAFCYVDRSLFPYLAGAVGGSYVISPGSADVGQLPRGLTREWLRQQLADMFGPPVELGDSRTRLLVWRIPENTRAAITTYPAVALVDSGPWSLPNVLPALQAMGIPAAFRQSFDQADFPPAPANLADSVGVLPRIDGGCPSSAPRRVGILAQTTAGSADVSLGSTTSTLALLGRSNRLPGWGIYGPVTIPSGLVALQATSPALTLGPCVEWSPLAATAFGDHPEVAGPTRRGANGEQLRAALTGTPGPWTELVRLYDPGWKMAGRRPIAPANGLFNLYHTTPAVAAPRSLVFTFSTLKWERRGQVLALGGVLIALLLIWRGARKERRHPKPAPREILFQSRLAPVIGLFGVMFLGLTALATALAWVGIPSKWPWTAVTPDPYSLDVVFGTMALALLGLSLLVRLGEQLGHRVVLLAPALLRGRRRRLAMATALSLMAAGCTGQAQNANRALGSAQQAGATSRSVIGSSLEDARIQQAVNNPRQCIADYTTALKTFPSLVQAYSGRAGCYRSGGLNSPAAVHDLDRALELSPDVPHLLLGLAFAHQGIGDLTAARNDYRAAAAAPSSTPAETLAAIEGLISIDEFVVASDVLRTATSRYPNSALVRLGVAGVATANDNDPQAAAALAGAAQLAGSKQGEMSSVLSRTCGYQVLHHQYELAAATCHQGATTSSDGSGAYDNLAAAHLALGQLNLAIVDLTSSIGAFQGSVSPDAQPAGVDGFGLANLLEARGRLYIEHHQPQLAIVDYQAARQALPPGAPDFDARLRADIATAKVD